MKTKAGTPNRRQHPPSEPKKNIITNWWIIYQTTCGSWRWSHYHRQQKNHTKGKTGPKSI